jgi:hypothetical protein
LAFYASDPVLIIVYFIDFLKIIDKTASFMLPLSFSSRKSSEGGQKELSGDFRAFVEFLFLGI